MQQFAFTFTKIEADSDEVYLSSGWAVQAEDITTSFSTAANVLAGMKAVEPDSEFGIASIAATSLGGKTLVQCKPGSWTIQEPEEEPAEAEETKTDEVEPEAPAKESK